MAKKPETVLVDKIMKALKERGGYWFKSHGSPSMRGKPDIIGCYCGRFYAFEVKTGFTDYDATELQQKNIRDIKKAGGCALVIYSTEEAINNLK